LMNKTALTQKQNRNRNDYPAKQRCSIHFCVDFE
jgi:hypothetical protein